MVDTVEMNTLDKIKSNASKGLHINDCHYTNFIEIGCHTTIRALLDTYKNGLRTAEEANKEFKEIKQWFDVFARAYVKERKLFAKTNANMYDARQECLEINNAVDKVQALEISIKALQKLYDDKTIGSKYVK